MKKLNFRVLALVMSLVLMCGCILCGCSEEIDDSNVDYGNIDFSSEKNTVDIDTTAIGVKSESNPTVAMKVKGYGTIVVELYPDIAPITVANFIELAESGFYDGLIFHRVIENFMIQGGDPKGDGTGGASENIKGEFSANGVDNDLKHERGVISMARSNDYDSASSQFFIMHAASEHLDGQYAAFGKVISGMDVVDKIATCEVDNPSSSSPKPVKDVVIEKMVVDKNEDENEDENESSITVEFPDEGNIADINTDGVTVTNSENPVVAMNIKDYGTVVIELYPDVAPISVENFVNLVESGFYNGITFHRVIEGFMIQGGDPDGDGIGGSDEQIKGEFYANGVENNLSHERGVISMARSNDYNSASSQFFIMHADYTSLDGQYAAFGKVISGMDVVDAIAACEVDSSNPNSPKPIVDIVMEKVVVDLNSYEAE